MKDAGKDVELAGEVLVVNAAEDMEVTREVIVVGVAEDMEAVREAEDEVGNAAGELVENVGIDCMDPKDVTSV